MEDGYCLVGLAMRRVWRGEANFAVWDGYRTSAKPGDSQWLRAC